MGGLGRAHSENLTELVHDLILHPTLSPRIVSMRLVQPTHPIAGTAYVFTTWLLREHRLVASFATSEPYQQKFLKSRSTHANVLVQAASELSRAQLSITKEMSFSIWPNVS